MILDLFIYIIQFYINQNTFLPGFIIRKKEAYKRHMEFFNCTPQMTSFIMGLAASMEEQNASSKGTYSKIERY